MPADGRMPESGLKPPPRFDFWKPRRQRRWVRKNTSPQGRGNYPAPQRPPDSFMPYGPEYEQGRRALEDAYQGQMQGITNQMNLLGPQMQQSMQRLSTNRQYATGAHQEDMAERGLVNSTVNPYTYTEQVANPYGRASQDLVANYQSTLGDLLNQQNQAALTYNQGLAELGLGNANWVWQNQPYNLPQYSYGQRLGGGKRGRNTKPRGGGNG